MTASSSGRLLISHITLRGPELAQLYALIARQPAITYAEVADAMLLPDERSELAEAPLRETLNFLLLARLLERQGSGKLSKWSVTPSDSSLPFPLLLLRHIRSHPDMRQRAITLVHNQLVAADTVIVTLPLLRDQVERGAYASLFAWTGEKIQLWSHLSHFIGLVRRFERSPDLALVPQPALVLAALRYALQYDCGPSLDACLHWIDSQLFACFTQRGHVHRGMVQTLLTLDQLHQIRLSHSADAAGSLLLEGRRVSEVYVLEDM